MRRFVPSAITLASQGLALFACARVASLSLVAFAALLALSLVLDGLDGYAARRLGAVSRVGARLDHAGDVAVCAVLLVTLAHARALWGPAAFALVLASVGAFALTHERARPVSLRLPLSIAAPVALWLTRQA